MQEPQELQLSIVAANGGEETNSRTGSMPRESNQPASAAAALMNKRKRTRYYRWVRVSAYAALVLLGQSAATLLGRLYYEKGGKSKWMATLVQIAGFPILLPYYYFFTATTTTTDDGRNVNTNKPSLPMLAFVYVSLGLLAALDCYLYSVGLCYLPVSTFSLICASQLAFNAFFSFFLNSFKFTPCIVNSLVLLTISSALLVFQPDSSDNSSQLVSKSKYAVGFICTVAASAGYGLVLSLMQLAFRKVLKKQSFDAVMDMIIYQSLVATIATVAGLFASGEWSRLKEERMGYETGKASYALNLVFTAVIWQLFSIGCVGMIFEVSSLFSNSISVLGVPVVPILAVVFFKDKMNGVKGISMVLAVWGILSYVYQHYMDDTKSNTTTVNGDTAAAAAAVVSKASSPLDESDN